MKTQRIVLTGGPASGKTTLLHHLQKSGFYCIEEISRTVIQEAQTQGIDQLFLTDPILFSQKLFAKRIAQYKDSLQKQGVIFFDRGIPDVLGYLDYKNESYCSSFIESCEKYAYDQVFILPPWQSIHCTDDERYENFEEACLIYEALYDRYSKLGYNCISVPFDTIENRSTFIRNKLNV